MAIKIKAKNKGKFTASAKKAGKSVQAHAHDVMKNPNSTPLQRKRANFARNSKKWKHENGGPLQYNKGGQNWTNNLNTQSSAGVGKPAGVSASQVSGYAGMAANALSPVIPKGNYTPTSPASSVVGGIKEGAKAVPFVGGFVQAGDMLGKGFQAGIDKANQKGNKAGAGAAAFAQGLVDPIAEHQKVWDLQKKGKISKGEAAGWSILNFLGGAGIGNAVLENKFKDDLYPTQENLEQKANLSFSAKPSTEASIDMNTPQDYMSHGGSLRTMSKYNNGGDSQLEHYDLPLHSQMDTNWANAQLDGKPVQINAKETIFRKEHGGDYVFSDNPKMVNPETGNTFAVDSKKIEKKTQKPYFDPAALNTKKYQMENLKKINDAERAKVESKESGGVPKALNSLNGEEIVTTNTPGTMDWSGKSLYELPIEAKSMNSNISLEGNFNKVPNAPYPTWKTPNKTNSNDLTTGDYLQLAGQVPALAYNTAMAFKKPEQQKLYLDKTPITQQSIAKNYNPTYLALNAAYKGIDEGSTSDAVRRAAKISALSNVVPKLQEYDLAVDNANQSLRGQYEDKMSNQARFNVGQRLTTDNINAQNRAATRAFGATAASNLGQGLTNFGLAKNQGKTNEIQYSTLQNLAANYGLDPSEYADFLKSKGVKIKYK